MTGMVEWGTLIWLVTVLIAAITGAVSMVIFAGKVLSARDLVIGQLRKDIEMMVEASDERAKLAESQLARDFSAYQLHCAETFSTKSGTTEAVERVENAVGGLSERMETGLERISSRIDKLFEGSGKPGRAGG